MNRIGRFIALVSAMVIASGWPMAVAQDGHDHDDHEHEEAGSHDDPGEHADHGDHDDHDDHDDHGDHGDHDDRDDHSDHEDGGVELSLEAVEMAGIRVAHAAHGRIGTSIHVPGEVGFDEDRLVHVVPRFAGVAKEVNFRVGDRVKTDDVVAVVEGNESLSKYSITAPITGWIIERHITPGEFVSEESPIYVIADLTHVWVNLAIYPKDADRVEPGQRVTLRSIGTDQWTEGAIDYVTPILDAHTRTMTARIVLPNPKNTWRPGTFVHADIAAGSGQERLVVEKDAVQVLDDEHVVFVPESDVRFRLVPVAIGESDDRFTEILGGLEEGMEYVAAGAFELKAKIVTSALGGHAGHGH